MTAEQHLAETLRERLGRHLRPLDARLRADALLELATRVVALTDGQMEGELVLVPALVTAAAEAMNRVGEHANRTRELTSRFEDAASPEERTAILREELESTKRSRRELVRDLAALRRHLDLEAVLERRAERVSHEIDRAELAYRAAASLAASLSREAGRSYRQLHSRDLIDLAFVHAETASHEAVVLAALDFIRALLALYPASERVFLLEVERWRKLRRFSAEPQRGCYVQVAALELCAVVDPSVVLELVAERLRNRTGRDGMIVRAAALRLLRSSPLDVAAGHRIARLALDDPSEHVRQSLVGLLAGWATPAALDDFETLCVEAGPIAVRGYALERLAGVARTSDEACARVERILQTVLERLSQKALPRSAWALYEIVFRQIEALATGPFRALRPVAFVENLTLLLASTTLSPGSAERLSALLLALEVRSDRRLDALRETFVRALVDRAEGDRIDVELPPDTSREQIEKALAVATQDDLPVSLEARARGRFVLTFGERRRFRFWRLLHELRTPAPDKRMGYAHSRARCGDGEISVAPARMGEVTPTRVPGERRLHGELGTWAQFLPRIDDLLSVLTLRRTRRRIVTSVGTLDLTGPAALGARLRVWFELSRRYEHYANLREVTLAAREPEVRREYALLLSRLGFRVELTNTAGRIGERAYDRAPRAIEPYAAASAALPPVTVPHWLEELAYTLASPRSSSAFHLALVVWLVLAGMVARAAAIRRRIERNLARIPLRIGGWGSRGKSGSERIKAALFHAMRFDVVVKTTGCEAMLIHARRDREARELFLYRPYDKATIWEQEKVVGFGARLGAQVFLWECMALQPRFVGILMDEWMQEELATLTNAYPDHEDIMGPAGEDVARVIGTFMPREGVVFTAEEQMLPLIRAAARHKASRLVEVGPIDAALLPRDLLARFPYSEHPSNIAMVLALAEHLGIEREWALVKMADYVVADLGVLKTYPTITVSGRRLTFSNGMSANERAGFLSNWLRLGYDEMDPNREPEDVTVVVVNNRADRVPRSHVFAQVVARDAVCEHIVLIGTNLASMQRFIIEQFEAYLSTLSLGDPTDIDGALERARAIYTRLRIVREPEALHKRLVLALSSLGAAEAEAASRVTAALAGERVRDPSAAPAIAAELLGSYAAPPDAAPGTAPSETDVKAQLERLCRGFAEAHRTLELVREALRASDAPRALEALRSYLRALWLTRIYVVWDSRATGDQVIDQIASQVAPGLHARVLGCQNIKGTGLDFAYRWVSIGDVDAALRRLEEEPRARADAIRWLRAHGDYGLSDARFALARVRELAARDDADFAPFKSELAALAQHLARVEAARATRVRGAPTRSRLARVLDRIEPFVDHLDSVRRSRRAARIMQDLFERRVSQGRAAVLLRDLVGRGKGGWLAADLLGKKD